MHHACEQLCKALAGQCHIVVLETTQTMIWTSAMTRNACSRAVGRKGVLRIQVAVTILGDFCVSHVRQGTVVQNQTKF